MSTTPTDFAWLADLPDPAPVVRKRDLSRGPLTPRKARPVRWTPRPVHADEVQGSFFGWSADPASLVRAQSEAVLSRAADERRTALRACHPSTWAAVALTGGSAGPCLSYSHCSPRQAEADAVAGWQNVEHDGVSGLIPVYHPAREVDPKSAYRSAVKISSRPGGNCVTVKARHDYKLAIKPPERTETTHFTDNSRIRLLKTINSFDRALMHKRLAVFITLTYPEQYPCSSLIFKRHIDNFRKSLERAYGRLGVVWKLEPQERGAPHFHFLAFMPLRTDLDALRLKVADWWCGTKERTYNGQKYVCDGIVRHVEWRKHRRVTLHKTTVEAVRHFGGAAAYAAKYVGKGHENNFIHWRTGEAIAPGRFWGVWRPEEMRQDEVSEASDETAAVKIRRIVRKKLKKGGAKLRNVNWTTAGVGSLTAFVSEAMFSRLLDHFMPWRKLGWNFPMWRKLEVDLRRDAHLADVEAFIGSRPHDDALLEYSAALYAG